MSLILEALKKLEREKARKAAPIMTAGEAPWQATQRRSPGWAVGLGALALFGLGAALGAWFLSARAPSASPAAAAAEPVPSVAPSASPSRAAALAPPDPATPPPSPLAPPSTSARPWKPMARPVPSAQAKPVARPLPPAMPGASAPDPATPPAAEAPAPDAPQATPAPPAAATPGDEPRLQAISERDGRRIVMINDQVMYEGDEVGDVRVIRIGDDEVEIEWRGKRRTLRF